ncbi:unnamed protein product [Owenia fusiformis]|uniref:Uncharacterized protein n=1 Tax=Owenia fusiformis TaxID=6347 RepID=A0A8J1T7P8_OWEFU|nr:unnamed protein product [Owenia fusiformis]
MSLLVDCAPPHHSTMKVLTSQGSQKDPIKPSAPPKAKQPEKSMTEVKPLSSESCKTPPTGDKQNNETIQKLKMQMPFSDSEVTRDSMTETKQADRLPPIHKSLTKSTQSPVSGTKNKTVTSKTLSSKSPSADAINSKPGDPGSPKTLHTSGSPIKTKSNTSVNKSVRISLNKIQGVPGASPVKNRTYKYVDQSPYIRDNSYAVSGGESLWKRQQTVISHIVNKINSSQKLNRTINGSSPIREQNENEAPKSVLRRSRTMPTRIVQLNDNTIGVNDKMKSKSLLELERKAKIEAEKAIRNKKVFAVMGPYPAIRSSLFQRGWVEKFHRIPSKEKNSAMYEPEDSDEDDTHINDGVHLEQTQQRKIRPCMKLNDEEENMMMMMSHVVRNSTPTLIFSVKANAVDKNSLKSTQMFNHVPKANIFTTKVGLCESLQNVPWYHNEDPNLFFPRCFRLDDPEDKEAFIDNFRLTACMNIVKLVVQLSQQNKDSSDEENNDNNLNEEDSANKSHNNNSDNTSKQAVTNRNDNQEKTSEIEKTSKSENEQVAIDSNQKVSLEIELLKDKRIHLKGIHVTKKGDSSPRKAQTVVPPKAVEWAMKQCNKYLKACCHDDIDELVDPDMLTDGDWDQLIQWSYQLIHDGAGVTLLESQVDVCEGLIKCIEEAWAQYEMDGLKNVWMVKPGAKSRGRGIECFNKLEDIEKYMRDSLTESKETNFVVQKYIERPLLVYNTKFDIRQWFLVTDWNPLTVWLYQDSYLRFSSQEYTLDNLDNRAIHLCNNSVQKYYTVGERSTSLPDDNMWTHTEFVNYLADQGHAENVWQNIVYSGMKNAIICSMTASQDAIEYRKGAFALYGADFMLTEDLRPWLIEINSSPSMEYSARATAKLCPRVLEDTLKVVIDRKENPSCDVGRFELIHKQNQVPYPNPSWVDSGLIVSGKKVRKPRKSTMK